MDKRLVSWIAASLLLFVVYLQFVIIPKQKKLQEARDVAAAAQKKEEDKAAALLKKNQPEGANVKPNEENGEVKPGKPDDNGNNVGGEDEPKDNKPDDVKPEPDAPEPDLQYASIGSADVDSPYRMLVTFTNEGAAVKRLELSSPRFRDLDDRGGHLGNLELLDDLKDKKPVGVKIQIVGAGTPAEAAGLQPGDVLQKMGDDAIENRDTLRKLLAKKKPKQEIQLTLLRNGQQTTKSLTLGRRPLEIIRPEIENLQAMEVDMPEGFIDRPSFRLALIEARGAETDKNEAEIAGSKLLEGRWEIIAVDEKSVTFQKSLRKYDLVITKKFLLAQVPQEEQENVNFPGYHLTLEITIATKGKSQKVAYALEGPTNLPTEGWWYSRRIAREGTAGLRDVIVRYYEHATTEITAYALAEKEKETMTGKSLVFAGIDSQYFASILIPTKVAIGNVWLQQLDAMRVGPEPAKKSKAKQATNVSCRLIRSSVAIEKGKPLKDSYMIFCGPKRPALLENYKPSDDEEYHLGDLVYYGWQIWAVVAGVMSGVLHLIYAVIRNYGLAIIGLTIFVRLAMFPLSRKQALGMAKMQELKPEMDAIKAKYKKDVEKATRAQQALWKKHNYNPMSGCLLALVQLPIFLGLYRALQSDIELRQAPLISDSVRWCSNLSAPDMLWDWSNVMPAFVQGWLGPYLNILPLITVILFVLQQKLFTPPPANEQAAMTQKMMSYMMIFIGFMFYTVPSGLCLYFITSSLWGIAERKLLPHPTPNPDAATTITIPDEPRRRPRGNNGGKGKNKSGKKKR